MTEAATRPRKVSGGCGRRLDREFAPGVVEDDLRCAVAQRVDFLGFVGVITTVNLVRELPRLVDGVDALVVAQARIVEAINEPGQAVEIAAGAVLGWQ